VLTLKLRGKIMNELSRELSDKVREYLLNGYSPVSSDTDKNKPTGYIKFEGNDSTFELPVLRVKRCVLIVDIVGYSKKSIIEQLLNVETLNMLFTETENYLTTNNSNWEKWKVYKCTGDGAIFVFGDFINPSSVGYALQFAVHAMKTIINHNNKLKCDAINIINVRMALSYDNVYLTKDLEGNNDILGDAINIAARLASLKEAKENCIFIPNNIYHNLQINRKLYYQNVDKSLPSSGELSDHIVGATPDGNNFLYIVRKGIFEAKDRFLEVFNISGRLNGIDILSE
jgi:class 3 adenylate cyclase